MTHYLRYCKNCGAHYTWQGSGKYCLSTPKEFNDRDYCPECKKAIIESLAKIEKKTIIDHIYTTEVTPNELLNEYEKIKKQESEQLKYNPYQFPKIRRVFASCYDDNLKESSVTKEVLFNEKLYYITYFPSKLDDAVITKKVRINVITNEVVEDRHNYIC
jgi:hypothetical protein